MTISAAAQATPIVVPNQRLGFVDESGKPTTTGMQVLQQSHDYVVNMNRIIPCNASGTNVIALTMLSVQPMVDKYVSFETFAAVAANNSTGSVTAFVVTNQGNLGTIKVFKNNGAAQAGAGDITANLQYFFTYVDTLDSGNGGFVLR